MDKNLQIAVLGGIYGVAGLLGIINLPELGGSKLIIDQGYNIETLVSC